MDIPKPQKYSKRRIAEKQIYRAILLLEQHNDPISALTLAGAAEEILGKMLRQKGMKCAFDAKVDFDTKMWKYAEKKAGEVGITLNIPDKKELERNANLVRNHLKHKIDGRPVSAYYRWEAEEMIARAISNYRILYNGQDPPQKTTTRWFENYTL